MDVYLHRDIFSDPNSKSTPFGMSRFHPLKQCA